MKISYVVDQTGEYPCCRAFDNPEVCTHCGYSSGVEIDRLRSLRPGAIREALRWYGSWLTVPGVYVFLDSRDPSCGLA